MLAGDPSRWGHQLTRLRALGRYSHNAFQALPLFTRLASAMITSMLFTTISYCVVVLLRH
jgi:hypothetical protein